MKQKITEAIAIGKKAKPAAEKKQIEKPIKAVDKPIESSKVDVKKEAKPTIPPKKETKVSKSALPPKAIPKKPAAEPVSIKQSLGRLRQVAVKAAAQEKIDGEDPVPVKTETASTPATHETVSTHLPAAAVRRPPTMPKKDPTPIPAGKVSFADLQAKCKENAGPVPAPIFDISKYTRK